MEYNLITKHKLKNPDRCIIQQTPNKYRYYIFKENVMKI